jgi:UDP:flavonoid glycosyltransferase YjiC (YdhE family)
MFVANIPDVSGAFFSDLRLARELQKRGHTVVLISTAPPRSFSGGE